MLLAEFPLHQLLSPFGIAVVAIVSCFTWLIVASAGEVVARVLRDRSDVDLKRELITQGLSTDEVVSIVEAGRDGRRGVSHEYRAARRDCRGSRN